MKKTLVITFIAAALTMLFAIPALAADYVPVQEAAQIEGYAYENVDATMFGPAPAVTNVTMARPVERNGRWEAVVTVTGYGWYTTRVSGGLSTPREIG